MEFGNITFNLCNLLFMSPLVFMSSHKFNDISVASCYLFLLMFFLLKDVEDRILPLFTRIQTTEVVVHKRFNCLMYVINDAF